MNTLASERRRNARRVRWPALLLSLLSISCPGDDEDDDAVAPPTCWCVPTVESVRILPGQFQVAPGSKFEMRARLLGSGAIEIPEFFSYAPQWTMSAAANVSVTQREGHSVIIEVPDPINPDFFDVIAEAGYNPAVASPPVTVRVNKSAPANDYVDADTRLDGRPLSVAIAWDGSSSLLDFVSPVAFSGYADVGDLRSTGGLMVFSSDRAMAFMPVNWSTAADHVRYKIGTDMSAVMQQDPQPPLVKDVTLWIHTVAGDDQWPATTADAVARIHLADANRTFRKNRIGIEFNLKAAYKIIEGTPQSNCFDWGPTPVKGEPFGVGAHREFDPATNNDAIDIFVINLEDGTGKGCLDPDGSGYRVFLNARFALPNVLGHELGHVLLAMDNLTDHENGDAIGRTNLMRQGDDEQAPRRSHLSIGQACRMNMSTVANALRSAVTLPAVTECPLIIRDVP